MGPKKIAAFALINYQPVILSGLSPELASLDKRCGPVLSDP